MTGSTVTHRAWWGVVHVVFLLSMGPAVASAETVLDHGGVCDGVADDRAAFLAMLADRGEIVVPAHRRCRLGRDVVIRRAAARVRCQPGGGILLDGSFEEAGILIAGAAGVEIEGCRFDLAKRTAVPAIASDDLCGLAAGTCRGGSNDGGSCGRPAECPEGVCETGTEADGRCRGGERDGARCSASADCAGDGAICEHLNSCWSQRGADVVDNEIANLPDAAFAAIRIHGATEGPAARIHGNRIECPPGAEAALTGIVASSGTVSDNVIRECPVGIRAEPLNAAAFVRGNTVLVSGRFGGATGISARESLTSTASVSGNHVRMAAPGGVGIVSDQGTVDGNSVLLRADDTIGIVAAGLVSANRIRPAKGSKPSRAVGIATVDGFGTVEANTIAGLAWGIVPRGGGRGNSTRAGPGQINKRVVGNEITSTTSGIVAITGWHLVGNTVNWIPSPEDPGGTAAAIWIGDPRTDDFAQHGCTEHSLISSNNLHTDQDDVFLVAVTPVGMRCRASMRPCRASDGGPDVCHDAAEDRCEPVRCEGIDIVANQFIRRAAGPASIDLGRGTPSRPIYGSQGPLVGIVGITGNMALTPGAEGFVAFSDDPSRYAIGSFDIADNTVRGTRVVGPTPP